MSASLGKTDVIILKFSFLFPTWQLQYAVLIAEDLYQTQPCVLSLQVSISVCVQVHVCLGL